MDSTCASAALMHLVDTLEQMAFVSVGPMAGSPASPGDPVEVTIRFRGGPVRGRLRLLTDRALGEVMAGNIAGVEGSEGERIAAEDSLRELVNVTAGSLLASWEGLTREKELEMSMPEVREIDAAVWTSALSGGRCAVVDADGHPVAIELRME